MGFQSEHTFSYVLFFHFYTSPFKKKNEIPEIIEHLLENHSQEFVLQ